MAEKWICPKCGYETNSERMFWLHGSPESVECEQMQAAQKPIAPKPAKPKAARGKRKTGGDGK